MREDILGRPCQMKTPKEIALIRRLARITDEAVGEALSAVRAGMTELDLAGILLKDTVLVTPEGCEVLSDRTNNDDLLIIP